MSRTWKDRPARINYPEEQWDYRYGTQDPMDVLYSRHLERTGVLTKKKRQVDTEYHWMTTPSWFIRDTMNRPQRRASKMWEDTVVGKNIDELEVEDPPVIGKKPHIYYW